MVWTRMGDEWWGYLGGMGMIRALIAGRIDIGYTVSVQCGVPHRHRYATLEAAQTAAQADWSAFILSALESTPTGPSRYEA
jgi:hypothetical protein